MSSIFNASISGLNAAQIGLATTQNNIANASTPGYNRQVAIQVESASNATGAGFIGQGVNVSTVQRMYNQFLSAQVTQQQGQSSQLNTYYSQIQQINNMLASTTTGVSPALQNFFNAVNAVASSPNSMPARQTMIGTAQSLATTFQSLSQQLTNMNSGVNGQITNSVNTINSIAQQIAALNQSIVVAQASTGQPPNSLMDQRDQLVTQLNQQVGASVVQQSDGSYNVSIGSGQQLVVGSTAFGLQTVPSQTNPSELQVASGTTAGSKVLLQQSSIQGGALGGVLAFRSQTLDQTQSMLGLVATGVAGTFNQQNALGQDLNGAMASSTNSFFTDPAPVVIKNSLNTGTATVSASISNYSNLTGSNYSLAYNGTSYTLTRLSDNTVTTIASPAVAGAGPAATIDLTNSNGITISIPAGAKAGDSYLIQPTINGATNMAVAVTDPAKIAASAPVMTNASINNTGTATVSAGALDLAGVNVMAGATAPAPITFSGAGNSATFSVDGVPVTVNTDVTVAGTGSGPGTLTAAIQAGLTAAGLTSYSVSAAAGGGLQIVHTGSLSAVAITNANGNASGNGIVNSAGTAGPIYNAAMAAILPATLTYNSITNTLSGFPATLPVTVTTNGAPPTTTSYPAPAVAVPFTSGATIDFGGINFSITGTPVNGDTFTVAQNSNSTTDNRNALLLANLQTNNTMQAGTANYTGVYSQLVSQIGVQTNSLKVNSTAQTNLLNTTTASQQALSGVNLDEEAANLLRYQQAYQAAGKAMQVASTLFDTLLSIGK
jgi:flagellar hook-associated protein 1 FlgK